MVEAYQYMSKKLSAIDAAAHKGGELFEQISEKELWKTRTKAYDYLL